MTDRPQPFRDTRYHERRAPRFGTAARLRRAAEKIFWPYPTVNLAASRCYRRIRDREGPLGRERHYLMVGSGIDPGPGVRELGPDILERLVNLDIERFERVSIVGDGRALPFRDASFDGVFSQSTLQLVLDPLLAIQEMERVLRPGGVLFLETPFLQPHLDSPTDSTRLTLSALREALRGFREIEAGPSMGPSSTFAWVLREYLTTWISPGPRWHNAVRFFLNFPIFPIRYLDLILNRREAAHYLAAAVYFLGEKS
jgi:SAM-dependent methyltransferase